LLTEQFADVALFQMPSKTLILQIGLHLPKIGPIIRLQTARIAGPLGTPLNILYEARHRLREALEAVLILAGRKALPASDGKSEPFILKTFAPLSDPEKK